MAARLKGKEKQLPAPMESAILYRNRESTGMFGKEDWNQHGGTRAKFVHRTDAAAAY